MVAVSGSIGPGLTPRSKPALALTEGEVTYAITGGPFTGKIIFARSRFRSAWETLTDKLVIGSVGTFTARVNDFFLIRIDEASFGGGTFNYIITPPTYRSNTRLLNDLPTSAQDLPPGALWNNAGVLCVA